MHISIQPVRLDTPDLDDDAVLIFRGDRLVAVASRLSDLHGELSGSFFIEAVFGPRDLHLGSTFASEKELRRWAESLDGRPEPRAAPMARSRGS
jgi:hypothetical protein